MSIAIAEQLKKELTDQYVVVQKSVPELRRFEGLTGCVKTVNMNGRALVKFDCPENIGWYDIAPEYLTVVDAPQPKAKTAPAKTKTANGDAAGKKPAAKAKGKSPLEMARAQGAQGTAKPAAAKTDSSGGSKKKLSPLELARQQGAQGTAKSAPAKPKSDASGTQKKLSPLEMARQQGAKKEQAKTEEPSAEVVEETVVEEVVSEPVVEQKASAPTTGADGQPLSKLEQARQQGPFKG